MSKPKYTIVLSMDSLGSIDVEYISSLPNFKKYINEAAMCDNVLSVYPSLTYPAHTSIITGKYPKDHGIVNNIKLQPNRNKPDWFSQHSDIRCDTILEAAERQGKKVASLIWPVTGKAKISYNMPEIFANRPWQSQVQRSLMNGSFSYQTKLYKKFGMGLSGKAQPELDNFVQKSLLHTIQYEKPDFTFVHFIDIDKHRHLYGVNSSEAHGALVRMDNRLGEIVEMLKTENMYEETAIIILGDHCQMDVHTVVYLNNRFVKRGYISKIREKIVNWKVFAQTCDGSAYIYLKDPGDQALKEEVGAYLRELQDDSRCGIGKLFTNEEAIELGADSNCAFMVEALPGFYFLNETECFNAPILRKEIAEGSGKVAATHGYLPTVPGYQTVFIAFGAGIRQNIQISRMSLVDVAPTIAKLSGITFEDTDGRIVQEILV